MTTQLNNNQNIKNAFQSIVDWTGKRADLDTTNKWTLVGAINENANNIKNIVKAKEIIWVKYNLFSIWKISSVLNVYNKTRPTLTPVIPSVFDITTVKATTFYSDPYEPWRAIDPSRSLIDGWWYVSWISWSGNANNNKFNVNLENQVKISYLWINNWHSSGLYCSRWMKDFELFWTNSVTAFENINYTDETNLTSLWTFTAKEHITYNTEDEQLFKINTDTSFQYYILKIANTHSTDSPYCVVRNITFYTETETEMYPDIPDISSVSTTRYSVTYESAFAIDNNRSKIWSWGNTSWISWYWYYTNQKINTDYWELILPSKLRLWNWHSNGSYADRWVKDFKIFWTNSESAYNNVTYTDETDLTLLWTFTAQQHTWWNVEHYEDFNIPSLQPFRYYVIKCASNFLWASYIVIRQLSIIWTRINQKYVKSNETDYSLTLWIETIPKDAYFISNINWTREFIIHYIE